MSEGIVGTIPCELFWGPLDGAKYGDLPRRTQHLDTITRARLATKYADGGHALNLAELEF